MSKYTKLTFEVTDRNKEAVICFEDEEVRFSIHSFNMGHGTEYVENSGSPFVEFNQWLATKPRSFHVEVFEIYKEIREFIDSNSNTELLITELNKYFIRLYSMVDLEEIAQWIRLPNSPIRIANKPASNYDRQTTYVYEDYLKLVAYSLALRFVAPVWADIDKRMRSDRQSEQKDIIMFEFILHDTIMCSSERTGYVCQAEQRLREYINSTKLKIDQNAFIFNSMSMEEWMRYLLANTIIRKISMGALSTASDGTYRLIINTYNSITGKAKTMSSPKQGNRNKVRKRPAENQRGDESSSQSVVDISVTRNRILAVERVHMHRAITNHQHLISILQPDLPMELYKESMDTIRQMNTTESHLNDYRQYMKPIQDVQVNIAKWVTHRAVSSEIYKYLELNEVIDLMGLVRAILWHRGFPEFAAIVSAVALPMNKDEVFVGLSNRSNLEQTVAQRLSEVFRLASSDKTDKRRASTHACIENIEKAISEFNWLITLPDNWVKNSTIVHKDKRLFLPRDLRNRVGELMIHVAEDAKSARLDF